MEKMEALNNSELPDESGRGYSASSHKSGAKRFVFSEQHLKNQDGQKRRMKVHPEGHILVWNVTFEQVIQRLDANRDDFLAENLALIKRFVMDARMGKTIKSRAKKKVGILRLVKYVQDLKKLDVYFKKPLDQVTETDMESFISSLEEGRIKTAKGCAYRPETQAVIKKLVKKFYRWLGKPELTDWLDTSVEPLEYKAISKEQVETILTLCTSTNSTLLRRNRALLMVLFDSGARADELLNVRLNHLESENDVYKIRIEFSKTKRRTITLPFCKKYLDAWLDIHPMRTEPLAQLFPINYNQLRDIVFRLGRFINVRLTPHSLRHSAATYWCQHLTQYELCYRLGWAMSSRMPQRYIDREGLHQEKANKIVKTARIEELETENTNLQRRMAILEGQLQQLMGPDITEAKRIIELVKRKREMFME